MEFNELKSGFKAIGFDSLRADSEDYFEVVVAASELSKFTDRLANVLGAPVWPSKEKLTAEIRGMIDGFGGITSGQTLYFRAQDSGAIFAMLWPWQDGIHITLKIVKK